MLEKFIPRQLLSKIFSPTKNERDTVVRKNVLQSFVYQFFTNVLGLLIVPLTLSYIDKEKYGIWINASVMISWLQNMNFGIGFGMQNHVNQNISENNYFGARKLVSVTYRYSLIIAASLLMAALVALPFIHWNKLYNTAISSNQLMYITVIAFISFLFSFVLGNLQPLLNAVHKTAAVRLLGLFGNAVTLIFLIVISTYSNNNLIWAALALALPTPLVYGIFSHIYFKNKLRSLKPKWEAPAREDVKKVFHLGSKFFVLQLTTLVIFQTDAILITQYLGPAEVTPYNIINRYFYFLYFIFSLGITPYWPAFTEAYHKKDFNWIKTTFKKLFRLCLLACVGAIIMFILSFWVVPVWSKHTFDIYHYKTLLITSVFYIILMFFVSVVSTFLNATSRLKIQLIVQVSMALLSIPIAILLMTTFKLGSAGVNISIIIYQAVFLLVGGLYTYKMIKNESRAANIGNNI